MHSTKKLKETALYYTLESFYTAGSSRAESHLHSTKLLIGARKMKNALLTLTSVIVLSVPSVAEARDQISIVGSSTVFPFVTVVAEEFGNKTGFKSPVIESTGTGGGFKLFCGGTSEKYPDFSNASRPIKDSERKMCAENGVTDITEIKIGYDGIVLANAKKAPAYELTKEQIFMALADKVPVNGKLIDNPYQKWSDVDSSLPGDKIEVYGPPTTSGTRDAFVELVMEPACKNMSPFIEAFPDDKERARACQSIRTDGHYIDSGEDDNVIISKLKNNPKALGIFGFSFLDQNRNTVHGSIIGGVEPTFENISDASYSISRSLFVYAKDAHIGSIDGMLEFVNELTSTGALGEYGYLSDKGLIPLTENELSEIQGRVKSLTEAAKSQ
jgi:phosphate transport system substrate-binding protein